MKGSNRLVGRGTASQANLKKNLRQDEISNVIRKLKSKNSLSDTRAAIAAHSRTMLSKALGSRRFNNATVEGKKQMSGGASDNYRKQSISFSAEEGDEHLG